MVPFGLRVITRNEDLLVFAQSKKNTLPSYCGGNLMEETSVLS
jgi:hypothetical protein